MVEALEQVNGIGINLPCWVASRAIALESPLPRAVQDAFRKDAPRGISGAKKKYVECFIGHEVPRKNAL